VTHPDLPTPKFRIGQRVFVPYTKPINNTPICPDCLGTNKQTVTTQAGESFVAECWCRFQLNYAARTSSYAGFAEVRTIGSIRIDTARQAGRILIEYMMVETGIGTGTIYYEDRVFEAEAEAQSEANAEAARQNLSVEERFQRERSERKRKGRKHPARCRMCGEKYAGYEPPPGPDAK
jgi:hypothetical protein